MLFIKPYHYPLQPTIGKRLITSKQSKIYFANRVTRSDQQNPLIHKEEQSETRPPPRKLFSPDHMMRKEVARENLPPPEVAREILPPPDMPLSPFKIQISAKASKFPANRVLYQDHMICEEMAREILAPSKLLSHVEIYKFG
uniref:Uncharacterized protein n=1 Tax=Vespula pensylvanica TaxID=30213 RepID=A0A834P0L4_VESPE|nr:hypothetical protein H0235_008475 [Vespula pensylvanica]